MDTTEPPLALVHNQFGPYHLARVRALKRLYPGSVHLVQLAASENLRAWRADSPDLTIETAVPGALEDTSADAVAAALERILDRLHPRVLAIAGYAHRAMRGAAAWGRRQGARTILMSDTQQRDVPRRPWREWAKRAWVSRHFDAAFVAGSASASYAESLGIAGHRIWRGYDVVDNEYFRTGSGAVRADEESVRRALELPRQYLLYVGRLSPEKNLRLLIDAFARGFRRGPLKDWALVLVGSGPQEEELRQQAASLGAAVRFVPFQQMDRLPAFYALAAALILPSTSEPWGLVVNEAMSSALPVVVSSQCGSAVDLVFPGVNGWIVDPADAAALDDALRAVVSDPARRKTYGAASARIVENYSLETWARALSDCSAARG